MNHPKLLFSARQKADIETFIRFSIGHFLEPEFLAYMLDIVFCALKRLYKLIEDQVRIGKVCTKLMLSVNIWSINAPIGHRCQDLSTKSKLDQN